ncbi:MAG TPA: LamG-like jellyroll fold domain-containing protein [Solirubrobacteraceae bacterium]|nr:LamG-like jellyroll fold domain-containing protein [Solirubrobacteraceae bacterium]
MSSTRRAASAVAFACLLLLVSAASVAASQRYVDIVNGTSGVQGYWRLGETFGTTAAAQKGPAGTYVNAPSLGAPSLLKSDPNFATGLSDGTGMHVSVPAGPAVDLTTAFTLEAWVKPDVLDGNTHYAICKGGAYALRLNPSGDFEAVAVRSDGFWQYTDTNPEDRPVAGQTYHVVATFNGTSLALYVNGRLADREAASGTVKLTSSALNLGACNGTDTWQGTLDEPSIANVALSAAQVAARYEAGDDGTAPAAPAGLKATAGDREVTLDWQGSGDADLESYTVYRASSPGSTTATAISSPLTATEFTDTGRTNGTAYQYWVVATDKHGNVSPLSAKVTVTPAASVRYRDLVAGHPAVQGYWRLAETSGTTAAAVAGDSGAISGTPALNAGGLLLKDSNAAIDFDGVDDQVNVTDADRYDATNAVSIEAWVRPDALAASTQHVLCKSGAYCLAVGADGTPHVGVQVGGSYLTARSVSALALGQTYHLVGTYDGQRLRLYVNGASVVDQAQTGAIVQTSTPLSIGSWNGSGRFNGVIDEPAVYDGSLTAGAIKDHYDAGRPNSGPAAPGGVTASAGDGQVSLDWSDNAEADLAGYDVYRAGVQTGAYTRMNTKRLTASRYTDFTAPNGRASYYVVKAVNKAGKSSAASAQVAGTPRLASSYRSSVNNIATLRAYWRLGETNGGFALPEKGPELDNHNSAKLGQPSLLRSDADPSVAPAAAASSYLDAADADALDVTTAWSVELWAKPSAWYTTASTGTVVGKGNAWSVDLSSTGKWVVWIYNGSWQQYSFTAGATLGTTQHVVVTHDGTTLRLYVDGTLSQSIAAAVPLVSTQELWVGGWADAGQYTGSLDELAIYGAPLSAAQVKEHYDLGVDNTAPSAPTSVTATPGNETVSLDWADNTQTDLGGYDVLRSSTAGGPYTKVNDARLTVSSFADTGLENGKSGYYVVKAYDKAGNGSASSAEVRGTPTAGTTLHEPQTLHSNGAELRWSAFAAAGETFDRYEVERVHNGATTLLATIKDAATTTFRDTTAGPGRAYTYRLKVNGALVGSWTVTLPADGNARKSLQLDGSSGQAAYVRESSCVNRGADTALRVGTAGNRVRGLIAFDLADIPSNATVSNATMSLYASSPAAAGITVEARRATAGWAEGTGRGTCTGNGATWTQRREGADWVAPGGDSDSTVAGSVARAAGAAPGWDSFDVTSAVRAWAGGQVANHGLLLRASDETVAEGKLVAYVSDEGSDPLLRPKLTVDYTEPDVHAQGPVTSISSHAEGEVVSGTVKLAAEATDDSKVTKVEFLVDGAVKSTDTSAPYEYASWSTTGLTNGSSHAVVARATDDAGNVTSSATTNVKVDNAPAPTGSVSLPAPAYDASVKASNPIAYYRFGEAAGATVAQDSSGNGRNATYNGTVTLGQPGLTRDGNTAAKIPSAVFGYIGTSALGSGVASTQNVTVELWHDFKGIATNDTFDNLVERDWGGWQTAQGRWVIYTSQFSGVEYVCFALSKSDPADRQDSACGEIEPGRLHVVASYDGTTMRMMVNGVETEADETPGVTLDTASPVRLGYSATQDIVVDDLSIYNTALTPADAQQHYDAAGRDAAALATAQADGPAGLWRLGEASGTTAADASGNGRSATLSGKVALGQPGLLGDGSTDTAMTFADDAAGDGTGTVNGLTGLAGSRLTAEAWLDTEGALAPGERQYVLSRGWGAGGGWRMTAYQSSTGNGYHKVELAVDNGAGGREEANAHIVPGRHHVAATYDGAKLRIFVDGVLEGESSVAGLALTTSAPLRIGGTVESGEITIDEAAVFDKALSEPRVRAHFVASRAPALDGTPKVTAPTTGAVSEVDFYVDGQKFATDTNGAPYEADLPTLGTSAVAPTYDGTHTITTKVYDANGAVTTSKPANVDVGNAAPIQEAAISSSEVPPVMTYDPAAATQASHAVDVAVQNTGDAAITPTNTTLRARWVAPDGTTTDPPIDTTLSGSASPDQMVTTRVAVKPPAIADTRNRAQYTLQFDLVDKSSGKSFAAAGNKPSQAPVVVNKKDTVGLGLERFHHYDGVDVGAGLQHLVNLASSNSLLRWTPFDAPGRGLSTVLDLTYNSLEDHSRSPAGNNWSVAISGLVPLGSQLDIHPNKADTIGGNPNNKWVELTDADGTVLRFDGKTATDGVSTYYQEPPGVNLYLRPTGSSDPARRWAVTKPDRTTFYFDGDGFPTSVEDNNGNRLTFVLETTPPGADPGGPKKRVTAVRDAGGRSFTIEYYSKSDVKKAHVRGKIKRILDHTSSALEFEYYQDGNLRRLVQKGGTSDGMTVPDRRMTFTYTTSNGAGPAIPLAADRRNPEPRTPNQSTRLYSVVDPRDNETTFAYVGPGGGQDRWRLISRTDRMGRTTSFSWNGTTRTATVARPLGRTSKYVFDAAGSVTAITNPKDETTNVSWTSDRQVHKVTEPLNPETGRRAYIEFGYDQNGYLTDTWTETRHRTELRYDYVAADANDVSGKWAAGRTQAHISQLRTKTDPKGVETATPTTDFQWSFEYDAKGNITKVTDPEQRKLGKFQQFAYDASGNGDLRVSTDALGHVTKYDNYDANGLAQTVTDPLNRVTRLTYNADGLLTAIQDPRHAAYVGGTPAHYRTQLYYDPFHRMGRQSAPKSTQLLPGTLLWTGAEFDLNDNVIKEVGPHLGAQFTGGDAKTGIVTRTYDAMDRERTSVGPDANPAPGTTSPLIPDKTSFDYDDADRLQKVTSPKGNQTARDNDYSVQFDYDSLDRVIREIHHELDAAGAIKASKIEHHCYDVVGNLRSTTSPRAGAATVTCSPYADKPFTTKLTYDDAHLPLTRTDPEGNRTELEYDANGNAFRQTDPDNAGKTSPRRRTWKYDERDAPVEVITPFDSGTRDVVQQFTYDAEGNLKSKISERAYDADADKANITEYVELYEYDDADQLVKTTLPTRGTEPAQYVHQRYDANGNQSELSLPTTTNLDWRTAPTLSAISSKLKTVSTHFDTGWVRTTETPGRPRATFDYTPEGWQAERTTPTRTGRWTYDKNGEPLVVERDDREASKKDTYSYDANDNLLTADNTIGSDATIEKSINVTAAYDGFDRPNLVTQKKEGDNRRVTDLVYDLNDNVIESVQNKQLDANGAVVKKGRRELFTYDTADRVQRQIDEGRDGTANTSDDREVLTAFTPAGKEKQRKISKFTGLDAAGKPLFNELKQQTDWTHYENGLLKTLVTKTGSGEIKESHDVEYIDAGVYMNGHRTKDTFILKGPNKTGAKCQGNNASGLKCVTRYKYDARDRLIQEDRDRVGPSDTAASTKTTKYTLDTLGNITDQEGPSNDPNILKDFPDATEKVHFDYDGTRLKKQTVTLTAGGTSTSSSIWSWYDAEGNLWCTTKVDQSDLCAKEASSHNSSVLSHQVYDGLDRLLRHRNWGATSGQQERSTTYSYDALDRLAQQTQTNGGSTSSTGDGPGDPRTTVFTYLGLSELVTEEREKNTDAAGNRNPGSAQETRTVRDFNYDAAGHRIGMSKTNTSSTGSQSTTDYTYGYDVHGSVSLLIDSTGASRARYGYSPYGECDNELTNEPNETETPDNAKSECGDTSTAGTDKTPVNPYRYSAKRYDTGSNTLDMGARRFSPETSRFLQEDQFEDALGDLQLSSDSLSNNRYSLAGGNPVSFVEDDGHMLLRDGGGGGSPSVTWARPRRRTATPKRRARSGQRQKRPPGIFGAGITVPPLGTTVTQNRTAGRRFQAQVLRELGLRENHQRFRAPGATKDTIPDAITSRHVKGKTQLYPYEIKRSKYVYKSRQIERQFRLAESTGGRATIVVRGGATVSQGLKDRAKAGNHRIVRSFGNGNYAALHDTKGKNPLRFSRQSEQFTPPPKAPDPPDEEKGGGGGGGGGDPSCLASTDGPVAVASASPCGGDIIDQMFGPQPSPQPGGKGAPEPSPAPSRPIIPRPVIIG